jgi:2-methylisocitrate lyase-like PEP mutase family enzyme
MNEHIPSRQSSAARLSALFRGDKPVVAPGVFNGLSARVAATVGFDCVYMSGSAVAASMGLPDVGLVTLEESVRRAEEVISAFDGPVFADADSGYGNAINVIHTIRRFERAGLAGIHLEDQVTAKKCGVLDNKTLISPEEMVGKLKAALDTRLDSSFQIFARTDAAGNEGDQAALDRAYMYQEAGADGLFIHALNDKALFAKAPSLFNIPIMTSNSGTGKLPTYPVEDLGTMGYKLVIFSTGAIYAAINTFTRFYEDIRNTGSMDGVLADMCDFKRFREVVRLDAIEQAEATYGGEPQ